MPPTDLVLISPESESAVDIINVLLDRMTVKRPRTCRRHDVDKRWCMDFGAMKIEVSVYRT